MLSMAAPTPGRSFMCVSSSPPWPNFTRPLLEIERNFDQCWYYTVLGVHWTLCFYLIGGYLAAILAGRKFMQSRPALRLRGALLFWNIVLAAYSTVSAWRMVTLLVSAVQDYGFHGSICHMGSLEYRKAAGFWLILFIVSKIVEFGDTAFIVLRKSPLIFLHWYHHVTVALFVWSSGAYASPLQFYFSTVNVVVHAVMYSYYSLKVLGVRIPKPISMAITALQLLQMVIGILLTGYKYRARADQSCARDDQVLAIATCIYGSYFLLFLNFFIKAYVGRRKPVETGNGEVKKCQ